MIVERFLSWIKSAPVSRRAEAANALSRSFLYSPLSEEERDGIEAALTVLLDDSAAKVRFALADGLAASEKTPHHIILTLVGDQLPIAVHVIARSPVLLDSELVDMVATREEEVRHAIASRPFVSRAVAAALAEIGSPATCVTLLENCGARLARFSLDRIVERHGDTARIRNLLLARTDLPVDVRQILVSRYANTLQSILARTNWMSSGRAESLVRDAKERAVVAMAFEAHRSQIPGLVKHLMDNSELTPSLLIRAVVSGQSVFFQESLSALSGIPISRIDALIASGRGSGLNAVLEKARLPEATFPAFASAIDIIRKFDGAKDAGNGYRRATHLIDSIVATYQDRRSGDLDQIMALLRRFAAEAKRDAARGYIAEVMKAA